MGTKLLDKFLLGSLFSFEGEGGGSGDGGDLDVSLGDEGESKDTDQTDDELLGDNNEGGEGTEEKEGSEEGTEEETDENSEEVTEGEETEDETKDLSSGLSVNRKAIEKKYPNIFKEFPELKAAIYREKAFVELFPTVEAAKDAENKSKVLDIIDQQVSEGKIDTILQGLAKDNKPALEEIAHSFLGHIEQLDEKLYLSILQTPFKQVCRWMYGEGGKHGNKNMQNAAILMHRALFSNDELDKDVQGREKPKVDPEREKLQKERSEFEKTRYNIAFKEVSSRIERSMTKFIKEKLDPSLGDWAINNIVKETINEVYTNTSADTRFRSQFEAAWKRALQEGYSDESKARLISTFLARAKTLIPSIRRQVVLNAQGKGGGGTKKVLRPQSSGTSSVDKSGKGVSVKEAKSKGMSDAAILGLSN